MKIGHDDRVRMERAHVLAWPALRSVDIDGWLWRCSGGGSQRANSVSTIDFHGGDLEAAVDDVERRYRAFGAAARFHTFDATSPPGLADVLRRRGYLLTDPTMTMFKRAADPAATADVVVRDHPWAAWQDVYLGEISEHRRAVNTLILDRIPPPRAFFGCRHDGTLVATALGVVGFGCAVIECVTTRAVARRRGSARIVLIALERWAARQGVDWIGLQVVPTNAPAVRLYEQLGFTPAATNRFWISRDQG